MSSFLDKFKLQTAKKPVSKFDLSCRHITTSNFMQLQPVYYRHLVPNQQIDIDTLVQCRMDALSVPTYGDARVNLRAFFVPYSLVFKGWNDFITDSVHVFSGDNNSEIINTVPSFTVDILFRSLFKTTSLVDYVVSDESIAAAKETFLDNYDIQPDYVLAVDGTSLYADDYFQDGYIAFSLSPAGHQVVKLLHSLGYTIFTDLSSAGGMCNVKLSALPLLAFVKAYLDWYYPSAYYQSPTRAALEALCKRDDGYLAFDDIELGKIFSEVIRVSYDSDYFVSAFDNPVGPNQGAASAVVVNDPANYDDIEYNGTVYSRISDMEYYKNTPFISAQAGLPTDNMLGGFTQYAIDSLRALTNYMKRHQLAGAKAVDRLIARFGGAPLSETVSRSIYLGSSMAPLQVRDVMSNADTSGAGLGDYAGKGSMFDSNGHFSYTSKNGEYGMLIIMASVVPSVSYYQGYDRNILRTDRLSFYTPEFDGMGTEAIQKGELFDDPQGKLIGVNQWPLGVFGFTPRYSLDKVARDFISGDFRFKSVGDVGFASNAWHLFRELDFDTSAAIVHSRDFSVGSDADQYLRMFQNTSATADHFVLDFQFRVTSFAHRAEA